MITYTRVISHDQVNQFYIMATSFLQHHPNRILYCLTDVEVQNLDGVVYLDQYESIDDYGDEFCFISPYIVFQDSVDEFLDMPLPCSFFPNHNENVRNDFYRYNKSDRNFNDQLPEEIGLNMSMPRYVDGSVILRQRILATNSTVLNTREFEPWKIQRNSSKTMIFPWENYFICMLLANELLTDEFKENVRANCAKHPYMFFYIQSGVMKWTD